MGERLRLARRKTLGLQTPLEPGTLVWVQDNETGQVWVKGEVQSIDMKNNTVLVKTDDGAERTLTGADKLLRCNADTWNTAEGLTGVNDLSGLTHLHEPEVLQALQLRFDIDKIYTFCGPILIAVNPFKVIPSLYDSSNPAQFQAHHQPPHIFSIAQRAFTNLNTHQQAQVVLISGESGAGKTETTKHVLRYLTERLGAPSEGHRTRSNSVGAGTEKKVLSSNPLLEAFGNACTTRNDNSSRFGKFIELQFEPDSDGRHIFQNAAVDTYLLEKIRVTELLQRERSYHIFYQACAAHERWGAEHFGIPLHHFADPNVFNYLKRSGRIKLDYVDDAEVFEGTQKSMDAMGIALEEQIRIIMVVAAVLHIGNIQLTESNGKTEVSPGNASFPVVADILGIKKDLLARALTHKLISVSATEKYDSPLQLKQSEGLRESFARMIYSYLFNHIVFRINQSLAGNEEAFHPAKRHFIGVLDIFGFEHFQKNSFEQLCINFANERLQQLFNTFVFRVELETYKKEGVTCDFADFPDNQDIIDLIQGTKMSIFTLLDEECRLPKGSDQTFCQKLWKTFDKNPHFKIEARKPTSFSIIHFAGPVSYDTANFLDKNMDELGELLRQAIESSSCDFVVGLLELNRQKAIHRQSSLGGAKLAARGPSKLKPNTVCFEFKSQLEQLMTKMSTAGPHFVRCIKPNPENRPDRFHRQTVADQLRSGGVIEALHVQRAGYPCRLLREACWKDISILFKSEQRAKYAASEMETRLKSALSQLSGDLDWPSGVYAVGNTTVFFKQVAFESMESSRIAMLNDAARKMQSQFRRYRLYKLFKNIRTIVCMVQAHARRFLTRRRLWHCMPSSAKRHSLLWKDYYNQHPDEAVSSSESEDPEEVAAREAELRRVEEERLRLEEEARQREEEEHRRQEEERLRLEREAEERRVEEERRRLEEAKAKAAEEERRRFEEEKAKIEEALQQERDTLRRQHDDDIQRLQAELAEVREQEANFRAQHAADVQRLEHEADVRKAEFDQQSMLASLREQQAVSRIEELERENKKLRETMATEAQQHATAMAELQESHRQVLAAQAEQHEAQRAAFTKQMEDMREALDEVHRQHHEQNLQREQEQANRFREEVQHMREREAAQRRRHEEELAEARMRDVERQRQWQAELAEAQRNENDRSLQQQYVQQQLEDMKADMESRAMLLETQKEEMKRIHTMQIEMLEQRSAERERTLNRELELVKKQRDEQVAALRAQLQFSKQELQATMNQEVELVKQQSEQRERALLAMLAQARQNRMELEKTAEVQQQLKWQQQQELLRCAEAKAKHMEDSARRQQQIFEQHVETLTAQMRESQENFRRQLAEVQATHEKNLQERIAQMTELENKVKADNERKRAQDQAEREEKAFQLTEAAKLTDKVTTLERENESLRKQLVDARTQLLVRARKEQTEKDDDEKPEKPSSAAPTVTFAELRKRRQSEPLPKNLVKAKTQAEIAPGHPALQRRNSVRLQLVPKGLTEHATPEPAAAAAPIPARQQQRRMTVASARGGVKDILGQGTKPSAELRKRIRLLRPSLKQGGKSCTGDVGIWREVSVAGSSSRPSDSAITVLCFGEARPGDRRILLAAACKSGAVSIYRVRRTALECDDPHADDEGIPDVEAALQFQGHAKAITSMCFVPGGEELVTTSSDWHVRIWRTQDGELVNRFVDSSLVVCAVPLVEPAGALVMANASAVLRLVEPSGRQQKVRLDHYARSLVLGPSGKRLLAATSRGFIHALDVDADGLRLCCKQQVSQVALTCLILAPCPDGMPPLVIANSMDSTICVLQANAALTNFTVLTRLQNPHKLLPLRCCHVPGVTDIIGAGYEGAGFIASGSEDGAVHIFDLDGFVEQKLTAHSVPVVDVTVAPGASLLASGDVHGRIILWRRGAKLTSGVV